MFHPQGPTFYELAVQALSSTERGYDLLAPKFDYTPFRTPQAVLDAVGERLRRWAPFDQALDLCCGTGAGIAMLRPLCRQRVVGLDVSRGMLAVCRERVPDNPNLVPVELVRGNALALPFGEAFDLVSCFGALGHIPRRDEPQFVQEIFRVLRPGGQFIFVTSPWPRPWSLPYWLARGFNAAMHIRNMLIQPPFIMFYLTFLLPDAQKLLEEHGFTVDVETLGFEGRFASLRLVCATRRGAQETALAKNPAVSV
jgi:ubiquinone/menaquinone biosynthesis C-methylase UbiE